MRKKISLVLLFLAVGIVFAAAVLAFDNINAHPKLTVAATEIYNNQAANILTTDQTAWIEQGSKDEDADPRYTNHYYNPVNNTGLTDLSEVPDIMKNWLTFNSARDWLWRQDSNSGDYSVPAILDNYRRGNERIAYLGIGHIMHLFQDMAVPAHTRNDSHKDGDFFEKWAQELGTINSSKVNFQQISDLNKSFDEVAFYSYNNFFSKDTVDKSNSLGLKEKVEIVNGQTAKYLIRKIDGKEVRVAIALNPDALFSEYVITNDLKLNLDYWNALYPKAVGYSAGVIDYFIKEFEKIDKGKSEVNLNTEQKIVDAINGVDASMMYGISYLWNNITYNGWQTWTSGVELKQTIENQYANFTEANKELAVNMLNQATILGVEVISSIKDPISASNLFKLQPVGAETVITYNPISSSTNSQTGQVTFVLPGDTEKSDQVWIFTVGTSTTGATSSMADVIAPTITISSAPPQYSNATSALFEFSADEFPVLIFCRADGADLSAGEAGWQTCQASSTLENLTESYHLFEIKAFDAYHNESAIASSAWLVDLTAPTASFTPLDSEYSSSSIPVYWSGEDPQPTPAVPATPPLEGNNSPLGEGCPEGGVCSSGIASFDLEYQITASGSPAVEAGWQPWLTSTAATSSIFNQTATSGDVILFRIRATDRAGNIGAWSEAQTKITKAAPPVCRSVSLDYYESILDNVLTAGRDPYCILNTGYVYVLAGHTLNIEPGTIIKFGSNVNLSVSGELNAIGTADKKIIFTSIDDNTYTPGMERIADDGLWRGLTAINGGKITLDYSQVSYAGRTPMHPPGTPGRPIHPVIAISRASSIITHSEISHNYYGIKIYSSSTVSISDSAIFDNYGFGINVIDSTTSQVTATNNWWGDATGPVHPTLNPGGLGARVSNYVDFIPWLTVYPN